MQTIEYDRSRLLKGSLLALAVCPVLGLICCLAGGGATLVGAGLLIGGPMMAYGTLSRLFGDATALAYDHKSVLVATLWKEHRLSWGEVADVDLVVVPSRLFGLIPVGRAYILDFRMKRSLPGKNSLRIDLNLLGYTSAAGTGLAGELERLRLNFADIPAQQMAALNLRNQHLVSPGPDPRDRAGATDAATAQFLANRAEAEAEAQKAARVAARNAVLGPALGRKSV